VTPRIADLRAELRQVEKQRDAFRTKAQFYRAELRQVEERNRLLEDALRAARVWVGEHSTAAVRADALLAAGSREPR
jgi:uncharacterized protein involved in exopolysaccharide biosynthesis